MIAPKKVVKVQKLFHQSIGVRFKYSLFTSLIKGDDKTTVNSQVKSDKATFIIQFFITMSNAVIKSVFGEQKITTYVRQSEVRLCVTLLARSSSFLICYLSHGIKLKASWILKSNPMLIMILSSASRTFFRILSMVYQLSYYSTSPFILRSSALYCFTIFYSFTMVYPSLLPTRMAAQVQINRSIFQKDKMTALQWNTNSEQ